MEVFYIFLGIVAFMLGFWCFILILFDAAQDEIWKAVVGVLCFLYLAYYAIFEYDHKHKWWIIVGALFGTTVGRMLFQLGGLMGPALE